MSCKTVSSTQVAGGPVNHENLDPSRLSRIDTLWSVVRRSHDDESTIAMTAQQQLVDIYAGAIRRYLVASVKDPNLAEDLFQEFVLKFVAGDFRNVNPQKGKFRHFVKAVIRNLVVGYHRKAKVRKERQLEDGLTLPAVDEAKMADDDEIFLQSWRDELLDQTWQALAEHQNATQGTFYTVLRMRVARPALTSEQLAQELTRELGKEISPGAARTTLHRARNKFANLMIAIIASSLDHADRESLESELIDLGLIDYCRETLDAHEF